MLNINKQGLLNIYKEIKELSSTDLQTKYWFEGNPGPISSFIELYNRLFDDDSFDLFVDSEVYVLNPPKSFIRELEIIRDKLNMYNEGNLTQRQIIKDPKWLEIVAQAKQVIQGWSEVFKGSYLWDE